MTRDVDAIFAPAADVRAVAEEVADRHGLEPDWLNDGAKGFMPAVDEHPRTVFEADSLLVQVPSPEYLLAMKLHASRDDRDLDDAATLFNEAGYTEPQQGVELLSWSYNGLVGSMGRSYGAGDNASVESFFSLLQKNAQHEALGDPR